MLPDREGFALIELMVVVALISVAAAVAVPRYMRHRLEIRQKECHDNLQSLAAAEKRFFEKSGRYTTDPGELGWRPEGKGLYQYRFQDAAGFIFECEGNIDRDPIQDKASIDQTGDLRQEVDDTRP